MQNWKLIPQKFQNRHFVFEFSFPNGMINVTIISHRSMEKIQAEFLVEFVLA
jgi:hypothetical protein